MYLTQLLKASAPSILNQATKNSPMAPKAMAWCSFPKCAYSHHCQRYWERAKFRSPPGCVDSNSAPYYSSEFSPLPNNPALSL